MQRYRIGFEEVATRCAWVDANPGYVPIVDMKTPFVFGACVALCDSKHIAQRIVNLLNAAEPNTNHEYKP